MVIGKQEFLKMLVAAAEEMEQHSDYLSEIDSRFGDGDHGITVAKIAKQIFSSVEDAGEESLCEFIEDLGDSIMAVNGGSAGPLYGTMIGGMCGALEVRDEIDGAVFKDMLRASVEEMNDITTAKKGDKTMMDALLMAVEAADAAGDNLEDVLKAAAEGAEQGAEDTKNYVSRFGRAKSYKEETIGTPDAGAVSTSLFFRGLANGLDQ